MEMSVPASSKKIQKFKQDITPWLFLAPAIILFSIYVLYPIARSFWISFFEWDGMGKPEFIGFGNYIELFDDDIFWTSIKNNILWLLFFLTTPALGLGVALFLNQKVRGIRLVKSLFFFPFVISQVVVGLIFVWFLNPDGGLLNLFLSSVGIDSVAPLSDENQVTYAIIIAAMWPQIAYCMILYLAGLNSINSDLIEAAQLDGARGLSMLWHIILPQLRPATFIAIVVTVIGALRSFDLVSVMTAGGPYDSSSVLAYFMYEQAILNFRMGYGAAIAVILFLIMLVYIIYFLYKMIQAEKK